MLARLQNDRAYKDLIEKRTQQQIAIASTGVGSGLRRRRGHGKRLRDGAMASEMEAVALAHDPAVQDAKPHLIAARDMLTLKEKQFESNLFNRKETVARGRWKTAWANKAGAEGFLCGAEITRADQLNLNSQNYSGNLVGNGPWWP